MQYNRIDVKFDRYREESVKNTTWTKRNTKKVVQMVIESSDVPLPIEWDSFIGLGENKADLARYLSEQLMTLAPADKTIVVSRGFVNEAEVQCSRGDDDISTEGKS